jgi:type II secretory ATPase GspE/PulE/Tfp pilus assembly ATPase PilB-like protein
MSKISLLEISEVKDLKKNWSIFSDDKNLTLTKEDMKNLVIIKYDKGDFAQKEAVIALFYKPEINKLKKQLRRIQSYAKQKGFVFQGAQTNKKDLISGIYKEWEENSLKQQLGKDGHSNEIKKTESIFEQALKVGASDIHLEKRRTQTKLRYRVNGEMYDVDSFFAGEGEKIARVIYQIFTSEDGESASNFDETKPQNGLIDRMFDNQRVRARIATVPANPDGFDVICRLLPFKEEVNAIPLSELGYAVKETKDLEKMVSNAVGVIIIAGTTGSGKSTTLKNVLIGKILDNEGRIKVITVEDPPEYYIPNATQVPVNRENSKDGGKTEFLNTIKAAMRSDPDIIMVGEVRDDLTADTLTGAVQSGHQVFTTIHAASAFGIINRLENFGVSREVLSSPQFISGLVYQKLLPKLCPHCSVPISEGKIPKRFPYEKIISDNFDDYKIDIDTIKKTKGNLKPDENIVSGLVNSGKLNSLQAIRIYREHESINDKDKNDSLLSRIKSAVDINEFTIRFRGQGCNHCSSGIVGRFVCAETIVPDLELLSLLGAGRDPEAINYWKTNLNGKFAMEDAIDKMKEGILDPVDLEHAFQELGSKII